MGCFSLHHVVAIDADRGHKTKGAETLRNDIRLDITIVVLAGPNEAATSFDNLGNDVIDKTVLIPKVLSLELVIVLLAVQSLEGVYEETVVLLQNGVLARELQGESSV